MSSSDPDRRDDSRQVHSGSGAWLHFAGIGGSGMSGLAQYHALAGGRTSGSDRAFDQGERPHMRQMLQKVGIALHPQDGSGLADAGGRPCDTLVVSTAVEDEVPDFATARRLGIPVLHRSELLARYVAEKRTIAVAGTSGKSTVTAMVFEILRGTGRDPSLLTGGNLVSLQEEGYLGNAWTGSSDLLVIEADESDGSLVRYAPWVGVLLNLRLDHKPLTELADLFTAFRAQTRKQFLVGEDEALHQFAESATMFGVEQRSDVRAENVRTQRDGSSFTVAGVPFTLPLPGEYNVLNAVAAVAACQAAGIPVPEMPGILARFRGVTRRFQVLGSVGGVEVIDDFAHNPDKIGAALRAAHTRGERVLAVFQPHGFGPTRFLRDALIDIFAVNLRPQDRLMMPEIFYAGGTVTRDISSRDITSAVTARDRQADFVAARSDIPALLAAEACSGDVILVMGARDPSLTDFCHAILDTLRHRDR